VNRQVVEVPYFLHVEPCLDALILRSDVKRPTKILSLVFRISALGFGACCGRTLSAGAFLCSRLVPPACKIWGVGFTVWGVGSGFGV
jgi:hypothetical protein